ncbi:endothelin-converting enzyme-like 1 isoform X2 [Dermacentor albipictus]|uniref:endothelin-converting enzyme-like 1 isoform X2 n=1 Tax=Dermacentor albipictus TaxID=60249 RepID=UPI0031FBA8CA
MLDSDLGYRRDWRDFVLIHSGQQEITVSYCTFRTALLCLIGTFSITLLIAIIFILLREGPPPLTRKDMVCEVRECQEHATLVARTLNRTLDPCQDFSAFVCSGWRPLVDYSDSVEVDARVRWTTSLVAQLNEGRAGLKIMNKPEALYRTCTLRSLTDVANATRELAAFMNQLGLPWPHRPPKPADPIDLLVKLSFVWDLPSWIRLSLVPGPKAQQRVVLRPAPPAYESQNDLSRLGDPRRFRDYWAAFYRAFSGRLAEFDEARVERFRLMESEIAGSFRQLAVADTQTPALTTLGVLAEGTPYSWAAALNRHVQTHSKLTDSDEVLLSDSRLRGTLSDLLERFGEDIQEHLGWAFVQKYGGVANDSLYAVRYQANHFQSRYVNSFACMRETEDVFGVLLAAHWHQSTYSPRERRRLDGLLNGVLDHVGQRLRDAAWPSLDNGTRLESLQRLQQLTVRVWPRKRFHSEQALRRVFRRFPSTAYSYVEMWIRCRRQLSALLVGDAEFHHEQHRLPLSDFGPLVRYDQLSNSVSAAIAALGAPFYYAYGIPAMWYGGLVSVFAREVVRAMSPQIALMMLRSRLALHAAANESAACEPSEFPWDPPNLELAAMELTFDMWQYQGGDSYLKDINYTSAQILFITACHVMCKRDSQGRKTAPGCNDAVRNFEPFARTFQCGSNAPMNPASKCSFFRVQSQTPFSML